MLKTRVIGVLVVRQGIVVQSVRFEKYLPVGKPEIAVEYLNRWDIDEIILLDIDATTEQRKPDFDLIARLSKFCHVPFSVGGGIRTVEDIQQLVHSGADKVVLNAAVFEDPKIITEGAKLFGNQCIVVSMDARKMLSGQYELFIHSGKDAIGCTPAQFAKIAEEHGAGEIFLNSIDRDGSKKGYDCALIRQVISEVNIPVIVCGGVSHPQHFQEAIELNALAVAAANFFHFTEHSPITVKSYLDTKEKDVRLDSYVQYKDFTFDSLGRISKKDDTYLEKLRFEYIPEEII